MKVQVRVLETITPEKAKDEFFAGKVDGRMYNVRYRGILDINNVEDVEKILTNENIPESCVEGPFTDYMAIQVEEDFLGEGLVRAGYYMRHENEYHRTEFYDTRVNDTFVRCVICEPYKFARIGYISNELHHLQKFVGGLIQYTYPFDDYVGILCNDEGKLRDEFELNRALYSEGEKHPMRWLAGQNISCGDLKGHVKAAYTGMYDIIVGNMAIVGLDKSSICDLEEFLCDKYSKMFYHPEFFNMVGDNVVSMQLTQVERRKSA